MRQYENRDIVMQKRDIFLDYPGKQFVHGSPTTYIVVYTLLIEKKMLINMLTMECSFGSCISYVDSCMWKDRSMKSLGIF